MREIVELPFQRHRCPLAHCRRGVVVDESFRLHSDSPAFSDDGARRGEPRLTRTSPESCARGILPVVRPRQYQRHGGDRHGGSRHDDRGLGQTHGERSLLTVQRCIERDTDCLTRGGRIPRP